MADKWAASIIIFVLALITARQWELYRDVAQLEARMEHHVHETRQ